MFGSGWRSRSLLLVVAAWVAVALMGSWLRVEGRDSREPRARSLVGQARGSRPWRRSGATTKEPWARSGPRLVVRLSGAVTTACQLAREGDRPPVNGSPEGRHRARDEEADVQFGALLSRLRGALGGAGPESTRAAGRPSTWTCVDGGHRHPSMSTGAATPARGSSYGPDPARGSSTVPLRSPTLRRPGRYDRRETTIG
jgi:hypothetical protein